MLCSDFSGLRNVPFGDEVQATNTHHTHFHTLTPHTPHPTHTRSQHKRSLRSRDARQRRAKQRIQNRATHRRNYRSWRSALTPTPHTVPSQGTGSLGQPHRQKPLYDLTGRTLSHRRLQQQRSRQQQQHTATPSLPATASNTHRCHRFRRFLQNLFKLKRKPPTEQQYPQSPPHGHQPSPTKQTAMAYQTRHPTQTTYQSTLVQNPHCPTQQEGQNQARPANHPTATPSRSFLEHHRIAGSSQTTHTDRHHAKTPLQLAGAHRDTHQAARPVHDRWIHHHTQRHRRIR